MSALFRFALQFCLDKYFYKNRKTLFTKYYSLNVIHETIYFYFSEK